MKYNEIKKKTKDELIDLLKNLKKENYNLRFQKKNGQLEKTGIIDQVKKDIAREKTKIFNKDNKNIGEITSGTFGPSVQSPVAMGYVDNAFSKIDTKVFLEVRGKKYPANICNLPFYKKSYVKGAINE